MPYSRLALLATAVATVCLQTEAADHFVSQDGTWIKDGLSGACYADTDANSALQLAINAAKYGDTVWVQNDYICATGINNSTDRGVTSPNRIANQNKNITIRGEDDDWQNGPVIRGQHDAESENGLGPNSMRCVFLKNACTLIGFRLEDGSCTVNNGDGNNGGGCIAAVTYTSTPVISNCFITGGAATRGGGAFSGTYNNCIFSNNTATISGGAGYNAMVCDSTLIRNKSLGEGGALSATKSGSVSAENCTITENEAAGAGGGAARLVLKQCTISRNLARGYGGGTYYCDSYNCFITGNIVRLENAINRGGGGTCGGSHYNSVIAFNTTDNQGGGCYMGAYFNCTIFANTNTLAKGNYPGGIAKGPSPATVANCISYGNTGSPDALTGVSSNSCLQVASVADATKYYACINTNPRLDPAFRPQSRFCKNAGTTFPWMTDPADIRSKDIYGLPRIIGAAPDIGAAETKPSGLSMLIK